MSESYVHFFIVILLSPSCTKRSEQAESQAFRRPPPSGVGGLLKISIEQALETSSVTSLVLCHLMY